MPEQYIQLQLPVPRLDECANCADTAHDHQINSFHRGDWYFRVLLVFSRIGLQVPFGVVGPSLVLGSLMGYTCAIVYNEIFAHSVTPCMMAVVGAGAVLAGVTHTLSVRSFSLNWNSSFSIIGCCYCGGDDWRIFADLPLCDLDYCGCGLCQAVLDVLFPGRPGCPQAALPVQSAPLHQGDFSPRDRRATLSCA